MKGQDYKNQIKQLADKITEATAIVIGAASGMSASAGFRHYYERDQTFIEWFSEFEKKYGYHNSFNGFYYRYRTSEERWAYISRMVCCILDAPTGTPYMDLHELLKNKNYFILTTNQDAQFERIFPPQKISAIQGDWRYFQCSQKCHDKLYASSEIIHRLHEAITTDLKVPSELIPHCPKCGAEMEPWVRSLVFLEGQKYKEEHTKLNTFLKQNKDKKILFLEIGVGRMTPMFIQEPFWNLTYALPQAFYITVNPKDAYLPDELSNKALAIKEDVAKVLVDTKKMLEGKNV
ncbi:MAG: NAD-dependent protein deacetylase [Lachnospiraceae bacterium]|nr:NAD-dependent protein deacetylase [Lachnospiraceae bacterium]